MAWLQQFLHFIEDIETSYHFIERGADVFEGEYDLRVMFTGNSPVGITPTTTTTSTKLYRDHVDDYVATLNGLNSWALFVVNISLEREDCRDKSFDPKGAELKADLDSAVMADVALCCILRSVFLLLGMMTEDREDSSYADVSAGSLPKQHAGSEENAAQRHVSPVDGHIYEIGHYDDESAQSQLTVRNLSGLIQVLDINDKGFQNRRGSLSLGLRAGGKRTEDNASREKLSMSLQCLCLLVRSSSDTLRVAAAGILDPSPHEFLLDIRSIASASLSDPVLPALQKGGLLPFGDFKNALDLDCHSVRGEGNDGDEDDAVASSEGKYEFKFVKISRTSRDLANNILLLLGPSSVEDAVVNSDSDSSRMAHAGEGLSNKVKGKNRIELAGNKEGDAAKMRIKEEKVTLMVIAMCRIWSNWPNSRLADMLVVRGIMAGFEAMGVRVSSAKHSTVEGLGGRGGVMGSKYVSGSKSSEEQASTSPAAASVPSSSSAFQPPVLLSSAALAASVPLGLRLVDRFQQQEKCLGKDACAWAVVCVDDLFLYSYILYVHPICSSFILFSPHSYTCPPSTILLISLILPFSLSLLLTLLSAPHTASLSCVASYIPLGVMFLSELVESSSGPLIASIRSVKHTTSQHNTACLVHLTFSIYPSHTINMISFID
jgi:hypothetical protein